MIISSKTNSVVAEAKKLKQSKYRKKYNLFMAEGEKNVTDSLKKAKAVKLFCTEDVELPENINCSVYTVTEAVMKEICDTVTPNKMACIFEIPGFRREEITDKIIVLNGVSDPGNVGTILRTACAMGYLTVICDDKTADVYSPKVVRSAMSAVMTLNILRTDNLKNELLDLKNNGYFVYSGNLGSNSVQIGDISFNEKNIIVMGNEGNGVDKEIIDISDESYVIPMPGGIESLNVAVASGITMYAALKYEKK